MRLTDEELARTLAKVAKINARAERRGFTGRIEVTHSEVTVSDWNEPLGLEVKRILHETEITGSAPSYDGWTFLASVDFDPEAGAIISTAPGVESVDRSALRDGACDHCQRDIATRRHIYLVRHEDGRQLQVGSSCIKDFLGWYAAPVFISQDSVEAELSDCWGFGGEMRYTTETVLAVAWATIQTFGFVPASSYGGTPTKYTVADVLDPRNDKQRELARKVNAKVADAVKMSRTIREWVLSDGFSGGSEYVTNLKALAAADSVTLRHLGLIVSAPQTWAKAQERDLIRRQERETANNTFAAAIKARIEIKAEVKAIRYFPGDWGTTTLYTLRGDDGRTYKWFSSSAALGHEVTGELVAIKGTVKKHDEYEGHKATVLTRCALLPTPAAELEAAS
jgi:ribonuclease P protein component